ncbi:unnamed protein product [Sphacelaria rigidula]
MTSVAKRECINEGCSRWASYGVPGYKAFCSKHARVGLVDVVTKKCGDEGCFKKPWYGVAGSKKAEFCSQHATAGMVNVVNKKCGDEGCSKRPSYGVAGSKKAEFCSQHAKAGMVDVVNRTCGDESCSKHPSYGVKGSKKAEFCSQHARAGMVNVVNKKCSDEGCSTWPWYGVAGSKKAEFCSKHARAGMVNVVTKRCGDEGCSKAPSYGVAGSKKAEFCLKHARAGMVNVVNRTCGDEGCSKRPSYGVAGSKTREFCSKHARAGMVNVMSYNSSKEERLKLDILKNDNLDEAMSCRQHPAAHEADTVCDMEELSTGEAISTRSTNEGDGGSVSGVRGTKRKRAPCLSSGRSDVLDARRRVYPVARRSSITPLFRSGQLSSGADREESSVPRVGAGMKVEVAAPPPTHGGAERGECSKPTAPLMGWSSAGGERNSSSSSCGVSVGRRYGSPAFACGSLGGFVGEESVEALEGSNVKLELGGASGR